MSCEVMCVLLVGWAYRGAVAEDPVVVGVISECALDAVDSAGNVGLGEEADGYWHSSYLFLVSCGPDRAHLSRCA